MISDETKYISVFIPVYNGQKYLQESITSVLAQKLPDGYELELLITDSGSHDESVAIIQSFGQRIVFNQIPNTEYGHGKTRQSAAERARGEYILFLSQDATPLNNEWLLHMIEPFFLSDKVGCVFGRQIPRPDAVPTIKREVATVFAQLGHPAAITIWRNYRLSDKHALPLDAFFSDVNSAIRKDLTHKIPFRDVAYAEDQALAKDMQENGYLKAYSAEGSVWHSNEYSILEFRRRKFDEFIGLQESIGYTLRPSIRSLTLGWIKPTFREWQFTARDRAYRKRLKIKYFFLVAGYNFMSTLGRYQAGRYFNDPTVRQKISQEARSKK